MSESINLGMCGLGTVGSAVVNVLCRNQPLIDARAARVIRLTHVGARRENPLCDLTGIQHSLDVFAPVNDPDVHIVLELIGGTELAKELVLKAIANGKHIVTANKALIAVHGNEIFAAAREHGVQVYFEAAVAGGIPVIKTLREGLTANRLEWLAGIINGTGNFILTEMESGGRAFSDVLQEAQEKGYAEADPTFDVEGIDAAHKLAILASIAFGMPLQFDKTFTEGISNLDLQDIAYAKELGYRIKHLGIARETEQGIELRVHPTLIPEKRLLANVDGVMNAVLIKGDAVGATLHYGAGAGGEATASAVIADVVDVARIIDGEASHHVPALSVVNQALETRRIVPIDEVRCAFYLRLNVLDEPGVLSSISRQFSDAGISLEAVIQKQSVDGEKTVPLILLTNVTDQRTLQKTLDGIQGLNETAAPVVSLRVESLG